MSTPPPTAGPRLVRFGLFEADLAAGELRKNGIRIRLQEQPFQVLALLLACPGDIVTREQLREKLWPADTFVDFDHSLNTAINKIREALGDSAASPRFVETLPRRGYRFIAPVQKENGEGSFIKNAIDQTSTPTFVFGTNREPSSPAKSPREVVLHTELEVPIPHRAITRSLFALIQLMYLIFYVVALLYWESVERIANSFLAAWSAQAIVVAVWLTALVGIPLRLYLFNSVAFDHRRLGENFRRLFLFILPLDELWALAPFLLAQQIGMGAAFAATAGLLYLPFSERALTRLAYPSIKTENTLPAAP